MTFEEYIENIAIPYREFVLGGGDVDAYPGGQMFVDADVTCHTIGCISNNVTRRILLAENADGIYRVACGTCEDEEGINNVITDIVFWGYEGVQFTV